MAAESLFDVLRRKRTGEAPDEGGRIAGVDEVRRVRLLRVWYFLGLPVLLGFLLGWLKVGRAASWPVEVSLAYWIGTALLSTGMLASATALLAPLLRRLRFPFWLTVTLGMFAGGFVLRYALHGWRLLLREYLYSPIVTDTAVRVVHALDRVPSNALLWILPNLVFLYVLRMPLFGYRWPGPGAEGAIAALTGFPLPPPRMNFMNRMRPERRGALLALEADGHYLRVHTTAGSDLISYRFSDAIGEVGGDEAGARVHRSWWVAQRAVDTAGRGRAVIRLVNGLEVPVSRSYQVHARARGWIAGGTAAID